MPSTRSLLTSIALLVLALPICALRNVTVDDTRGDELTGGQIIYNPPSKWQLGQSCSNCTAELDASKAFDSTWHDASYFPVGSGVADAGQYPTASYTFNGESAFSVRLRLVTNGW